MKTKNKFTQKSYTLITLILISLCFTTQQRAFSQENTTEETQTTENTTPPAESIIETFKIDQSHSSVIFCAKHMGISKSWGRFNDFSGTIKIDREKPENSSVEITIKAASIDTNNEDRDKHLRSDDFFSVKQYPTISFKSTEVKQDMTKFGVFTITGNLSFMGQTKNISVNMDLLGFGKNKLNNKEIFACEIAFKIKRSEFGMTYGLPDSVSDEVKVIVSIEAEKQ